jgi:uncharacterized membrane protein YidH (DUF202 family)
LPAAGWQEAWQRTALPHLLFGYGARTLRENWPIIQAKSTFVAPPESAYLTLLLENGLVGAGAMFWVIGATLVSLYRAYRTTTDEEVRRLLWAVFCAILGFLVSLAGFNAFESLTLQVLFWGTIGMGLGVVIHLCGKRREILLDLKLGH